MRLASISFDAYPNHKGAATHIRHVAQALSQIGELDLVTLPGNNSAESIFTAGVRHTALPARGHNLIDRVRWFREALGHWFGLQKMFDAIHFRSIYEGYPIAKRRNALTRNLIYEVNGLPSVELKYHYPKVADDEPLLAKLRTQEQFCLHKADMIITPSTVTAKYLVRHRGVVSSKIHVIPNGADPQVFTPEFNRSIPKAVGNATNFLYAGTVAPWQGVDTILKALKHLLADSNVSLTLAGPVHKRFRDSIESLIDRLGLRRSVKLLGAVPQKALVDLHHEADAVLAPLKRNDRNCSQGCCPLKIIEAMSCASLVIASDLPVVRDIMEDKKHGLLVPPDQIWPWVEAMKRVVCNDPVLEKMRCCAHEHVVQNLTWDHASEKLRLAYRSIL